MRKPASFPWLVLLALISAALLALCFPYPDRGSVTWIALVPFFAALQGARRPGRGAWLGLIFGLAFFFWLHRYLLMYGFVPTLGLALLEAAPLVLFGALAVPILERKSAFLSVFGLAGAWVLQEALRGGMGPLSLTFGQIGYTQHAHLSLLQFAAVAGTLGISFVLALVNAALARLFARGVRGAWPAVALSLAIAAGLSLHGLFVLRSPLPAGPSIPVGVVQPNVRLSTPVSLEEVEVCRVAYPAYTDLLMSGLALSIGQPAGFQRPELVLWPETALPVALNQSPAFMRAAQNSAVLNRVSLLMGALEVEGEKTYNQAWLFDPSGVLRGTYAKQDLVMFGEYVPFREQLPFLQRYPIRSFDFSPGSGRPLLSYRGYPFGVQICFEAIFPRASREEVRAGAQFLAFLTSDAWAGPSSEVLLHSNTAPLRAVETGRWVVRAAATGRSAIISPRGKIMSDVPVFRSGEAHGAITPLAGLTPYMRYGDAPLLIFCGVLIALGMAGKRRGRSHAKQHAASGE